MLCSHDSLLAEKALLDDPISPEMRSQLSYYSDNAPVDASTTLRGAEERARALSPIPWLGDSNMDYRDKNEAQLLRQIREVATIRALEAQKLELLSIELEEAAKVQIQTEATIAKMKGFLKDLPEGEERAKLQAESAALCAAFEQEKLELTAKTVFLENATVEHEQLLIVEEMMHAQAMEALRSHLHSQVEKTPASLELQTEGEDVGATAVRIRQGDAAAREQHGQRLAWLNQLERDFIAQLSSSRRAMGPRFERLRGELAEAHGRIGAGAAALEQISKARDDARVLVRAGRAVARDGAMPSAARDPRSKGREGGSEGLLFAHPRESGALDTPRGTQGQLQVLGALAGSFREGVQRLEAFTRPDGAGDAREGGCAASEEERLEVARAFEVQRLADLAGEVEEDAEAQLQRERELAEIEREALALASEAGLGPTLQPRVVAELFEDLERSRAQERAGKAALAQKLEALERATAAHEEGIEAERTHQKYDQLTMELFYDNTVLSLTRPSAQHVDETPAAHSHWWALSQGPLSVDRTREPLAAPTLPLPLQIAVGIVLQNKITEQAQHQAIVDVNALSSSDDDDDDDDDNENANQSKFEAHDDGLDMHFHATSFSDLGNPSRGGIPDRIMPKIELSARKKHTPDDQEATDGERERTLGSSTSETDSSVFDASYSSVTPIAVSARGGHEWPDVMTARDHGTAEVSAPQTIIDQDQGEEDDAAAHRILPFGTPAGLTESQITPSYRGETWIPSTSTSHPPTSMSQLTPVRLIGRVLSPRHPLLTPRMASGETGGWAVTVSPRKGHPSIASASAGSFDTIWDPVRATAIVDWNGGDLPEALTLRRGQVLLVEFSTQAGWSYGSTLPTKCDETEKGWFPAKFALPKEILDAMLAEDEKRRNAMRMEQRRMTLWSQKMANNREKHRNVQLGNAEKLVLFRMLCNVKGDAFLQWKIATHDDIRQRQLRHKVLSTWGKRSILFLFRAWCEYLRHVLSQRDWRISSLNRFKVFYAERLRHGAIQKWRLEVVNEGRLRLIMMKALARMSSERLGRAFGKWIEETLRVVKERVWLVEATNSSRLVDSRLQKAFDGLALGVQSCKEEAFQIAAKETEDERKLKVAVAAWNRATRTLNDFAFSQWALEVRRSQHLKFVCSKIASRVLNSLRVKALNTWIWNAREQSHLECIALRVVKLITQGNLVRRFEHWHQVSKVSTRHRRLMQRALETWEKGFLLSYWRQWIRSVTTQKCIKATESKLIRKIKHFTIKKAICRWQAHAREQARMEYIAGKVVTRMQQGGLMRAFERWQDSAADSAAARAALEAEREAQAQAEAMSTAEYERKLKAAGAAFSRVSRSLQGGVFGAWAAEVRRGHHHDRCLARVRGQLQSGLAARAFNTWQAHAREQARMEYIAGKVVTRMQQGGLMRAFERWQDSAADSAAARAALEAEREAQAQAEAMSTAEYERKLKAAGAAFSRVSRSLQGGVFGAWAAEVRRGHHHDRCLARVRGQLQSGLAARAFNTWQAHAREQARMEYIAGKVVTRMQQGGLMRAFERWQDSAADSAAARAALEAEREAQAQAEAMSTAEYERKLKAAGAAFSRVSRSLQGGVFGAWAAEVRRGHHHDRCLARVRGQLQSGLAARAFNTWQAHAREQARMEYIAGKVVTRMQQGGLMRAFERWQDSAADSAAARAALEAEREAQAQAEAMSTAEYERKLKAAGAAFSRVSRSLQGGVFGAWAAEVRRGHHHDRCLARVRGQLQSGLAARAFNTWQAHAREQARMEYIAGKVVTRMQQGGLMRAFERWHEIAREHRRVRRLTVRVVEAWGRGLLVSGMERWHLAVKLAKSLRASGARVIVKMQTQTGVKALNTWRDHAQKQTRLRKIGRRVVMRMEDGTRVRALERWKDLVHDTTEEQEYRLQQMNRCRVTRWPLARAFADLVDAVQISVDERERDASLVSAQGEINLAQSKLESMSTAEYERKLKAAGAAFSRVSRSLQGGVFGAWAAEVRRGHHHDRCLARVRGQLQSGLAARAFNTWQAHAREQARMEYIAGKVVTRMQQGGLMRAFERWQDSAADSAAARAALEAEREAQAQAEAMSTAEYERKLKAAGAAFSRVSRSLQGGVFGAWAAEVRRGHHHDRCLARVRGQLQSGLAARAFNTWQAHAREQARMEYIAGKVVTRMQQGGLMRAFERWQDSAADSAAARAALEAEREAQAQAEAMSTAEYERKLKAAGAAFSRVSRSLQGGVFGAWAAEVRRGHHHDRCLARVRGQLQSGLAARAFNTWQAHAREQARMEYIAGKVVTRMQQGGLMRAFERWHEIAREHRRVRRLTVRVVEAWGRGLLVSGMERWHLAVKLAKSLRASGARVIVKMQTQTGVKALNTWRDHAQKQTRLRKIGRRVVMRMEDGTRVRALERWKDLVHDTTEEQEYRLQQMNRCRVTRWPLARAFADLVDAVQISVDERERDASLVSAQGEINLAQSKLESMSTAEYERKLKAAGAAFSRVSRSLQGGVFGAWAAEVRRGHHHDRCLARVRGQLQSGLAARAFNTWQAHAREQARMEYIAGKVVTRMQQGGLMRAFERWQDSAADSAAARAALEAEREAQAQAEAMSTAEYERKLKAAGAAFSRVSRSLQGGVFGAWAAEVRRGHHHDRCLARVRGQLQSGLAARAFNTWQAHAREQARMEYIAGKVVTRMQQGGLMRAFERWHEIAREHRRVRRLTVRVVEAWGRGLLVSGMERWHLAVKLAKSLRASGARVIVKMQTQTGVKALNTWRDHAQKQTRLRKIGRRVVMRMEDGTRVRALERWKDLVHDTTEEQEYRLQQMNRCRVTRWPLARAFADLVDAVQISVDERERDASLVSAQGEINLAQSKLESMSTAEYERKLKAAGAAFSRVSRSLQGGVFGAWAAEVRRGHHHDRCLARVRGQLQSGLAARAFNTWQAHAREQARMEYIAGKVVTRMQQGGLMRAFERWQDSAADSAAARAALEAEREAQAQAEAMSTAEYERKLKAAGAAFSRVSRSLQGGVFGAWAAEVRRGHHHDRCLARVRGQLQSGLAARAFNTWQAHAREQARMEYIAGKVVTRMQQGGLMRAFERWHEIAREHRRVRRLTVRVVEAWGRGLLVSGMERWHLAVKLAKSLRASGARVIVKMQTQTGVKALNTWRDHAQKQTRLRKIGRRVVMRMEDGTRVRALERWKDLVHDTTEEQEYRLQQMNRCRVTRWPLARAFADLVDAVQISVDERERDASLVSAQGGIGNSRADGLTLSRFRHRHIRMVQVGVPRRGVSRCII